MFINVMEKINLYTYPLTLLMINSWLASFIDSIFFPTYSFETYLRYVISSCISKW